MKKIVIVLMFFGVALSLNGCGTASSGVMKVDLDKYVINTSSTSSPSEAKKIAYSGAVEECLAQGKEVFVIKEKLDSNYSFHNMYNVDLSFKCIDKSTKDVQNQLDSQENIAGQAEKTNK